MNHLIFVFIMHLTLPFPHHVNVAVLVPRVGEGIPAVRGAKVNGYNDLMIRGKV